MIRLFVPDELAAGAVVALGPEQTHYLRDVMRRDAGDEIALFNGRDGEWLGALSAIDRKGASVSLTSRMRAQAAGADLELVVALVKRARLETIIEKATELGAARIRLTITRFTQVDRTNVGRLTAIAIEAAEQTGRLDVPEVRGPEPLESILDSWPNDRPLIFCDEGGDASPILSVLVDAVTPHPPAGLRPRAPPSPAGRGLEGADPDLSRREREGPAGEAGGRVRGYGLSGSASILIGPEGGFSPEERACLRALPFVTPVSLGPRILRADTAAIAALALWQAALGDWAP
jgi:16S rRNA (uracil1498-N3)-methyltransferase